VRIAAVPRGAPAPRESRCSTVVCFQYLHGLMSPLRMAHFSGLLKKRRVEAAGVVSSRVRLAFYTVACPGIAGSSPFHVQWTIHGKLYLQRKWFSRLNCS